MRAGLAATLLLLVALGACGDGVTDPGPPVLVHLVPSGRATLGIGDTLTVRAVVQNASRQGVTFASSDPAVATVERLSGLVRGVAAGQVVITATSVADDRAYATVQIEVEPDLPSSLVISSLTDTAGDPVDPTSVRGVMHVHLAVERGSAVRLEVLVDTVVGCEQTFTSVRAGEGAEAPPAGSRVDLVCSVNTAAFDSVTGVPRLRNGPAVVGARLVSVDGRELASAGGRQIALANANRLVSRTSAARQAVSAGGAGWISGDVTVEITPVLFDPGISVSRVEVRHRRPDGTLTVRSDTAAPFRATLEEAGPLLSLTDSVFRLAVSSTTGVGGEGPAGTTSPLRYDSEPPTPGTVLPLEWVGRDTRFSSTYGSQGESDRGVGRTRARFYAGDPELDAAALVERGVEVVRGDDLPQAPLGAYRLAVRVCDALENCALREGFRFGVDLTPPVVTEVTPADRAVNPEADLVLQARDDLSGFAERPYEVSLQLLGVGPAPACGPVLEGVDLPGRLVGNVCAPDTVSGPIPAPRTSPGYYTYSVVPFDRAGNRGSALTRTLLIDLTPPVLGAVGVPPLLSPGEEMEVTAQASDGLDLARVSFELVFPREDGLARIGLSFVPPVPVGVAFDGTLTTTASAAARFPFVRSLTYGSAAAGSRITVLVDSLRVAAHDAAGWSASGSQRLAPAGFGNDTSTADPFAKLSSAAVQVDRTSVCTGGCQQGEPTSLRVSVRVVGEGTGPAAPFARLHLYRQAADGKIAYLGSVSGTPGTTVDTGAQTTFTYLFPEYTPPPGLTGSFVLFAVGVSSKGNGLITDLQEPDVEFYER